MSVNVHAALVVAVCAGVTLLTRAMPFLFFGGKHGVPRLVARLGETLPSAIMGALVVYCLKDVPFGALSSGVRQLIAAAAVVLIHLVKRSVPLSIGVGTVLYMVLIRL